MSAFVSTIDSMGHLSQKDIEICLDFDLASLPAHEHHDNIQELHNTLTSEYKNSDD